MDKETVKDVVFAAVVSVLAVLFGLSFAAVMQKQPEAVHAQNTQEKQQDMGCSIGRLTSATETYKVPPQTSPTSEPSDVPPVPSGVFVASSRCYALPGGDGECIPTEVDKSSLACADPSRFLLQSEDGKWHCLKLVPGDAGAKQ